MRAAAVLLVALAAGFFEPSSSQKETMSQTKARLLKDYSKNTNVCTFVWVVQNIHCSRVG